MEKSPFFQMYLPMCSPVQKELVGCTSLEPQPGAAEAAALILVPSTTQGAWPTEPTNPHPPLKM